MSDSEKNTQSSPAASKNLLSTAIIIAALIVAGAVLFSAVYSRHGNGLSEEAADRGAAVTEPGGEAAEQVNKSDMPDVKLFVMSYCPYGLQMQKGFLPVYELLRDKAKMEMHFVNYIMHGKEEIDENLRQYCLQKEQEDKYSVYLTCFLKEGKGEECLSQANVDAQKLSSCVSKADKDFKVSEQYNNRDTWLNGQYPKFDVDKGLCEKYGVRGSPTLVINDTEVAVNRSPEAIKEAICQAFISPPEECGTALSSDFPSAGFGEGTSAGEGGGCQ